jgi:hypothetical protein
MDPGGEIGPQDEWSVSKNHEIRSFFERAVPRWLSRPFDSSMVAYVMESCLDGNFCSQENHGGVHKDNFTRQKHRQDAL